MLDSLHIKNFRCFEDLTIPSLGRVNLIVGKNNSGKSTLLDAMRTFASRGNIDTLINILDSRDELVSSGEDKEQDFLQSLTSLFSGRELPNEQERGIFIGSITDITQHLHIETTSFIDYIEVTEEASERTIRRRRRIPIEEYQSTLSIEESPIEDIKTGISISFGGTKTLIDSTHYRQSYIRKDVDKPSPALSYVPTQLASSSEIASLWDKILFTPYEEEIKQSLSLIEENILDIGFVKSGNRLKEDRKAIVKMKNLQRPIPLKSMGEGISRLLQLFLYAFQSRGGFLLIDEFENGLHYSIQEEVWEKLFILTKKLDIQLFATTHSEDAIKAFCKVALRSPEEGHLISLGRSAYGEDKGKIIAVVHDESDLQYILDTGMEVR